MANFYSSLNLIEETSTEMDTARAALEAISLECVGFDNQLVIDDTTDRFDIWGNAA